MKRLYRALAMLLFASLAFQACGPDISQEEQQRRKAAEKTLSYLKDDIMKYYYYWNTSVPDLDYTYDTDVYDFFDDLLWEGDRWSWMMDGQDYMERESGIVSGSYGASFAQPIIDPTLYFGKDYNIMVRYVYPDSPFDKAGVKRGWTITAIDDIPTLDYYLTPENVSKEEINARAKVFTDMLTKPSTTQGRKFTFLTGEGETVVKNIVAATTINTRPTLVKKIFTSEDYPGLTQKVGYFHYLAFMAEDDSHGRSMLDDIPEAMAFFKENNVKTLILDLRYNGGGDSRASNLMVSYITPASTRGNVYVKRTHNRNLSALNEESKVQAPADALASLEKEGVTFSTKPDSPLFEHIYIITSKGSASASEMVLNGLQGLKPLMDVKHVGGVTYGKPNGMYVFMYPSLASDRRKYNEGDYSSLKYVFLPICFYNHNGLGAVIPDEGITPEAPEDFLCPDDLFHDFDASEMNIAACLYNVVHGEYPQWDIPKSKASAQEAGRGGIIMLNREDTDKNYGTYLVKPDFF